VLHLDRDLCDVSGRNSSRGIMWIDNNDPVDETVSLTWAPGRSIASRGATCSGGHRKSSRARRIPSPVHHSFRRMPRDDACYERHASCRGRCNQIVFLKNRCLFHDDKSLIMRVRDAG